MKKISILFLITTLFSSQSCEGTKQKIPLFKTEFSTCVIDEKERYFANSLSHNQIESLREKKADFLLYVYVPGCGTCELFPITLNNYIKETNVVINYCLLNTYNKLNNVPNISNSSFIFFIDGKVDTIEDLTNYTLKPQEFTNMLNKYTYITNVEILNPIYIETYLTTFFPSYVFTSFITNYSNDALFFSNLDEDLSQSANILLLNETKIETLNYEELLQNYPEMTHLGFISEDLSHHKKEIEQTFQVENFKTYNYIEYKNGALVSCSLLD